jgi:cytochrome b
MRKIRIWDLPVRLFHWVLVVLIVVAVVTQKVGGNAMEWHFRAGYAVLTLIVFRIIWGLVGPRYARFSSFLPGPAKVTAYLRDTKEGRSEKYLGHNPLGSLSVFALLGVILAQAVSGMLANDDIASEGPLVKFISKELSDSFTWFHKEISANLLYVLVGLHVLAIVYYYFAKKKDLVTPMITGDQQVGFDAPASNDSAGMRLLAAIILVLCAAAVYFLINLKSPGV